MQLPGWTWRATFLLFFCRFFKTDLALPLPWEDPFTDADCEACVSLSKCSRQDFTLAIDQES